MRRFNFGISCLAIASTFFAASSCSDDLEEDGIQKQQSEGDKAYIAVTISTPDDGTRAVGDATYPFVVGDTTEHKINRADFFFFDKNNEFISHTEIEAVTGDDGDDGASTENIEFKGQTAVIVNEYNALNPPAYVMTVLNLSSDLEDPVDYDDFQETVMKAVENPTGANPELQYSKIANCYKTNNGFLMTTSSYTDSNRGKYDVTYLTTDNFKKSKKEALEDQYPVNIYVERLAAKVAVNFGSLTPSTLTDNSEAYQIGTTDQTINELQTVDGVTKMTATTKPLYAKILGWGINGQPARSNLFKHINTSETDANLGFTWNDANNYRSYWGESFNYGSIEGNSVKHGDIKDIIYYYYPKYEISYSDTSKVTRATEEIAGTADANSLYHLLYLKRNELTNAIGTPAYCPENTNSAAVLQAVANYQGAVSCALINAQVVDGDGKGQDLISYNSKLYTTDAFKSAVLSAANIDAKDANGKPISADDLAYTDASYRNGHVDVALATTDKTWKNSDGDEVSTTAINNALKKITPDENPAVIYNDGAMYYSIPIEHLRNDAPTKDSIANKGAKILEGQFGVVRNHIYQLNITQIINLGHGINNDDEPIVPPLEKDEKYYIGVKVNILSWKTVSQSVTL
jgi:hypothetical protein